MSDSSDRSINLYTSFIALFCVVSVVSNLLTVKLVQAPGGLALPLGLLTYPVTFMVSDLVTEVFGARRARFMIYLGFCMNLLTHAVVVCAIRLPPHPLTDQSSFESTFGTNSIAVYASMAAYIVGQILDIQLFAVIKRWTGNRLLWARNVGSTLASQWIDTVIVTGLYCSLGLHLDAAAILPIIAASYFYKAAITVSNIPVFYWSVSMSKKYLNPGLLTPSEKYETLALKTQ